MSHPSNWALPQDSVRFVVPRDAQRAMAQDPLCQDLYPLGMGQYRRAAGHVMQRHTHDDHLLLYCTAGEGQISLNTTEPETQSVIAGDLVLLPSGIAHQYRASPLSPWSVYWVHFLGDRAALFLERLGQHNEAVIAGCLRVGMHATVVTAFEQLLDTRNGSFSRARQIDASNRLRTLLSDLAQRLPAGSQGAPSDSINIESLDALMQTQLGKALSLDTLAAHCKVSRFHLVKRYRDLTGTTPIKRFIEMKMAHGCYLLDTTAQRVGDVARALGYLDACYFSRSFKRVMGISPSEYRARHRSLS